MSLQSNEIVRGVYARDLNFSVLEILEFLQKLARRGQQIRVIIV